MEKVITIHQPDFIPWLGYFDRWRKSDLFVALDDVQFIRKGWQNRDRLLTKNGVVWLTVPVMKKGRYTQLIRDVQIDNSTDWKSKHLRTIETGYKKAANFEHCFSALHDIYSKNHDLLIELNMDLLAFIAGELGIQTPTKFSSTYGITTNSTQRLVDIVRACNGSSYLTGTGARDYLDVSLFDKEGLRVIWQEFEHPVYDQNSDTFVPMLSSLDYLMSAERKEKAIAAI